MVWALADLMVRTLFDSGAETVILDACNISRFSREEWMSDNWTTVFKVIDTPVDVCRQRAIACGRPDLLPVIDGMAAISQPLDPDEQGYF